ncbi:hypothetical protein [Alteromonas gracilis]|uniref:hypothetical protein n=1 Tax=Alteromonas gracilis TaxID=1479524 RepID=UPI0030CBEEAA
MFYPEKYEKVLERNEYVFDVRLPGGTKTVSEFIKKITAAEECQKNTFIELSLAEKPHFGFHCFRITTEIQYLCRYEINRCMEGLKKAKQEGVDFLPTTTVQESIIRHYQKLDQHIEDIFKALAPKNFLFIGDHSTSSFEYEGNADVWLANNGYLNKEGMYKAFKRRLTKFLSNKFGVNIANTAKTPAKKGLIRRPITRFDADTTKAFGTFYDTGNFAGIFINDEARFGGAINSENEINELVDKICQEFNSDETNIKYQISAEPYKRNFLNTKFCELMPDIKLQKPDNIYFSSRRWEYLIENPYMKPIDEPIEGKKYPFTGAKGSDPLFVYSTELDKFIHSEDPNDLRMTYRLIKRYFSNGAP